MAFPRAAASTKARGYGQAHTDERKRRAKYHHPDDPCSRCGKSLGPIGPWLHLDHDDHDRNQYLGFSHAGCNTQAGAVLGRSRQTTPPHHTPPATTYRAPRSW